jgi:GT2 family glycosyltransferase
MPATPDHAVPGNVTEAEVSAGSIDPLTEATGVTATADDVTLLYHLVMLREPDESAMAYDPGRPLDAVLREKLNSEEFLDRVVPHVLALRPPVSHRFSEAFEVVRSWAAARLPGSEKTRTGMMRCGSAEEIVRQLLQDEALIRSAPRLIEAGIDRLLRLRLVENDRIERAKDILGDVSALEFELRGWCANRADPAERLTVEIFADNLFLGAIVCDRYLAALERRLGGDGRHGFRFVIPAAFLPRFRHERLVSVLEHSTGVTIGSVRLHADRPATLATVQLIGLEIRELRKKLVEIESRLPKLEQALGYPIELYGQYISDHGLISAAMRQQIDERCVALSHKPLISFVMELDGGPLDRLMPTIESLREQIYDRWELLLVSPGTNLDEEARYYLSHWQKTDARIRTIASGAGFGTMAARLQAVRKSKGEWFGFVSGGDRLTPDAAFWLAAAVQEPDVGLVYTDEDVSSVEASAEPCCDDPQLKGSFDEDLLLATDYIGNLCVYRRDVFDEAEVDDATYAEIFDYYLKLRILTRLQEKQIRHVCRVLYHRQATKLTLEGEEVTRSRRQSLLAACAAEYLRQTGRSAAVEPHTDRLGRDRPLANRIRWSAPASWPALSILVPTRDRMDLLGPCLTSTMAAVAGYSGAVELMIIDNDSVEPESKKALRDWAQWPQITVLPYRGTFSWSAINNYAVERAKGDILLFLNNDTFVLSDDWCLELVTQACRREVGAVGVRLLYQDGTVQHGGIILGKQTVLHEAVGETPEEGGYLGRTQLQRGAAAVTGACLATRRDVFQRVSGFDPAMQVEFSDIDYCLKVRSIGLRVIYTPFATMYHFESKSRGLEAATTRRQRETTERAIFMRRWQRLMGHDPFCDRHFGASAEPFRWLSVPPPDPLEPVDWSRVQSGREEPPA